MQTTLAHQLRFWDALQRRHRDELGFLPFASVAAVAAAGRLMIATDNDDPCGFLLHGPPLDCLRVYQTCVCEDTRRVDHGSDLVAQLVARARAGGSRAIVLHCAEDLAANRFWSACGFHLAGSRVKSRRTGRPQLKWILPLVDMPAGASIAELDARRPPRPRCLPTPKSTELQARLGPLLSLGARVR